MTQEVLPGGYWLTPVWVDEIAPVARLRVRRRAEVPANQPAEFPVSPAEGPPPTPIEEPPRTPIEMPPPPRGRRTLSS